MKDNDMETLLDTDFDIIEILNRPDADRGYTIKELEKITNRSYMTVRNRLEKAKGLICVKRLFGRSWTRIYALDNKKNRVFFGVEE